MADHTCNTEAVRKDFLKVIDNTTLGYVDFRGNRQYISVGNINSSRKASLFLMDYAPQQRLKIWAESEAIDADQDSKLLQTLEIPGYKADVERLIIFRVQAYDWFSKSSQVFSTERVVQVFSKFTRAGSRFL